MYRRPLIFLAPDEPVAGGDPVVEETPPVVEETPPVVEEPAAPADAPWSKDLAERFTDEAVRAQVDAYMREKQAPYITKLETERAEAVKKNWVYDQLNENPEETIRIIAAQVWDDEKADAIAALVAAGATEGEAEEIVEEVIDDPEMIDLDKLPPQVRAAVEFAETEKARQAEQATADAQAAADAEYATWLAATKTANPDIAEGDLHAYAYAALNQDKTLEDALTAYRAAHPVPAAPAPAAPATVRGHGASPIEPQRRFSALADAFDAVYDGAAGTAPVTS